MESFITKPQMTNTQTLLHLVIMAYLMFIINIIHNMCMSIIAKLLDMCSNSV